MTEQDEDFRKRFRALFTDEVLEHVDALCFGLVEWGKAAGERRRGIIESLYREAHSLAGASRSLTMPDMEAVCRSLEGVFTALRNGEIALSSLLFDALSEAFDAIRTLAAREPEGEGNLPAADDLRRLGERLDRLSAGSPEDGREEAAGGPGMASRGKRPPAPALTDAARISSEKLAFLLQRAEDLRCETAVSAERNGELQAIRDSFAAWKDAWEEVGAQLDGILQAVGFRAGEAESARIDAVRAFLAKSGEDLAGLERRLATLGNAATRDQRNMDRLANDLLDDAMGAMRQPFSTLLDMFPAFVRDLARDQGKECDFTVRGGNIEGDRRIMEVMKCTLIHLIKYSLDRGVEKPEERLRKRKPPRGRLECAVSLQEDGAVEVFVADDGAGIDAETLAGHAVPAEAAAGEEGTAFGRQGPAAFLFHPGASAVSFVTNVAGLGLGLAMASEKLGAWGGTITAATKTDRGTTFRVVIPLPVSTLRGVLVRVGEQILALPAATIGRVVRIRQEEVKTIKGRDTLVLDEQVVALYSLGDVLELRRPDRAEEPLHAVVLASAQTRIAFAVDEVLREQEIVVKSWGRQLSRVRNVAGATMLGNGRLVPVLHVGDLVKSAVHLAAAPA